MGFRQGSLLRLGSLRHLAIVAWAGMCFGAFGQVRITQDAASFVLANGQVTARISKVTGDLTSVKFHNLEMMGRTSGHPAGYWEQNPENASQIIPAITIDPGSNNGERGEVSIKGISGGKPLGGGGPGGGMLCDLEIRYALGRDDSGVYTYAIFSHPADYPVTDVGESRFAAKLNPDVFDWMSMDDKRNRLMPAPADWDHGSPLNMKEARRLTTGLFKGQVEHKYDYSAVQFDAPAYGWSSTKQRVGFYFINPSMEYLGGGPMHVELTGHLDNNDGANPTLINNWRANHYGGGPLHIAQGEEWMKVVGPMYLYFNAAADPNTMYRDALSQAAKQTAAWPYAWVHAPGYAPKSERAVVSGRLAIHDPAAKSLPNLLVGLAYPDAPESRVTWQSDAKHYEFWVRGTADGGFQISNVLPGNYQLHAIADGVFGEYAKANITVAAGQKIDLGTLDWTPVRYGPQLWEIGIPNRSGIEFFKGDEYFHWGWYLEYPKLFPNDVTYTIGKSDYRKDWFFEQVPHATSDDPTGRGMGRSTTWTIRFDLAAPPSGRVTLRLGLAGVGARRIDVAVNDKSAGAVTGLVYNATINRDGIAGMWAEKDLTFDASLLQPGTNTMQLTIPGGILYSGIIYDYLRLEAGGPEAR